ncbi:hypothetical protein PBY51_001271 [Eleginops maclovinus]|uniref:HEAT repeat-containing protein 1 n=1 Tax=Eleginops maclovinus TaxID=56733 RepID=A0AAN7WX44_ELEMC|nr:hypothetical protein PBY51_001271 [Eleginops maclovinus]
MTSLAHQLKRLALPQTDPNLLTRKEVASLLFDPKDAASMDRSTFYALGCTGLEELLGIEPAFQEFQESLFSRASLTLERSVQSREVNERLDAAVALFLARLCPYFLLKPAHKCIEWLVHRFHIQRYSPDTLLGCALPYHDTTVFVRVLQLLHLRESSSRWSWLLPLQKAGVPLSRGALVSHCCSDLSFMDFICSLVTKSIQAYSGVTGSSSQLRVVFSFYASSLVSSLESAEKLSDAVIGKLLPFIHKGLSSPLPDYTASSYMLVCQLAVKEVLEGRLVEALCSSVCRSLLRDQRLLKEGLGCLTVLLQSQGACPGNKALGVLVSVPLLVSSLQEMCVSHDVSPLLKHLMPHLLHQLLTCSPGESQTELSVLESVLQNLPLTHGLDQTVARLLLDEYLSQSDVSAEHLSSRDRTLQPLIRLFESRYCGALDDVLAGHVTGVGSSDQKRLFHRFLSLSMSSGKHQIVGDSDTSLLLSLKHPQCVLRVSALTHLKDALTCGQQSLDAAFLRDAVVERLQDDEPAVAAAAIAVLELLLDVLDPEDVVSSLLSLLLRGRLSHADTWLPVLKEAVRLLSDPRLGKGDAERLQRAGWRLLPLIVLSSPADLPLSSCLTCSPLLKNHPLTLTWEQELEALMKTSSDPDFLVSVNERFISTVTRNISGMEKFCRRDALEKLSALVEKQKGPSLGARTSFLVLTRVLLLVLGEQSETQHLLTAQRVFLLLERPLLEVCSDDNTSSSVETQKGYSFSTALSHFLLDQQAFRSVLVALLRDFISNLRCPDEAFKAEVWWNPEKLDTNTCCYLSLTLRLFSLLISGASEGPSAAAFRDLMKLLIQVHFPSPLLLFRFLSLLWGYGGNHGDQLDIQVGAVLQTRALYLGAALLTNQSDATLQELSSARSPVFPSLLCCLSSPVREVRRAGLSALQSLSAVSTSPFQPITEKLLKTSEEIIADPAYLSQALGFLQGQSASPLQTLLQSVQTSCCPSYSASCLLRNLRHVHGSSVLSGLLPVLERLLEQSGPGAPPLLRDEAQLVLLVLGKFSEESASLLDQDQSSLDLFIRALKTPTQLHPDLPSCQTAALEQMTKPFFSSLGEGVQQRLLTVIFGVLTDSRSPLVASTVSSVFKRIAVDGQQLANELAPPEKPKVKVTVQQTRRSRMSQRKPVEAPGGSEAPEEGAVCWRRVSLVLELLQHKKKLKRAQSLVPVLFSLLHRSLEPWSL